MAEAELKQLLKLAYTDINYLLQEGFDSNVQECEIIGVKDTIKEIEEVIGIENTIRRCPQCTESNLTEDKSRCWNCDGGPG